jgi:hypothetical protein
MQVILLHLMASKLIKFSNLEKSKEFCVAGKTSEQTLRTATVCTVDGNCALGGEHVAEDTTTVGTASVADVCQNGETLHQIRLFVVCRNEEVMIRQTLEHYKRQFPMLRDITVLDNYSTDGSKSIAESLGATILTHGAPDFFTVEAQTKTKNTIWKPTLASPSPSWVIIIDMDEWIQIDADQLLREQCQGTTMIKSQGYQMVANSQSTTLSDLALSTDVIHGHRDFMYSKHVVFLDSAISDINYNQGAHGSEPEGHVVMSRLVYPLYHLKYLGLPFLLVNYKDRYERSRTDRANKLSVHYINGENEIKELFMEEAFLANLPGAHGSAISGFNDVSTIPMTNPDMVST